MSFSFAIALAIIFLVSIVPALVYFSISRKLKRRWRERLRRASEATEVYTAEQWSRSDLYPRRRSTTQYFIGDISCQNNAHSPYLRCAIAPDGPCDRCPHYEPKHPKYDRARDR